MTVVLTIITCIPIFALTTDELFLLVPEDMEYQTTYPLGDYDNLIHKYYIMIRIVDIHSSNVTALTYKYKDPNNVEQTTYMTLINSSNNKWTICPQAINNDYCFISIPTTTLDVEIGKDYYIPIYTYNCIITDISNWNYWDSTQYLYTTITMSQEQLLNEAYNQGYYNGYKTGMTDGMNSEQYTNITGYVTQLLTRFVGSDTAPYITPISIVLVILFVYFLFIRFLLSLIKAKGVIKTCDIIMIVACIILLVVMYAPMLNLTIKTEQINNIETTETTIVRRTEYTYDEQGRIIGGPAGTIIYDDIETTSSDQMVTEDEVTFQYLEKEITTYEETQKTDIRD